MRKLWLSLLLAGCAATSDGLVPPTPVDLISPEADLTAPGMIPVECEALLQKSQSWGYRPGEKWRPQNIEVAKDAATFLASFSLVPENTHRFYTAWETQEASKTLEEATKQLQLLERAQVCDSNLALAILDGLMQFQWPKADKVEAGKNIHRFILNQQARKSFLMQRAISIQVMDLAYQKGFLAGSRANLVPVRKKLEKMSSLELTKNPLNSETIYRNELRSSDEIRADLSRLLPLP